MEKNSIKPYIDAQIKLEEQYYGKLHAFLAILILQFNDYMGSEQSKTLVGLSNILGDFLLKYHSHLRDLNQTYALSITSLSYRIINGYNLNEVNIISNLRGYYIHELVAELGIKILNLIDTIKGRYIAMIPVGSRNNNFSLFTDDNSKDQLIHRNNVNISRFAQMVISEAVFNTIINDLKGIGATEYLADNQHDGRVRETHVKYFNGENWINFDAPPPCGHVATEAGCRCFIIGYR